MLWQLREISSGNGYTGSGLRAHFGLGDATNATIVRIEWPSGTVQELRNVAVNQIITVTEPPSLAVVGMGGFGEFQMLLRGRRGAPYVIRYSTNLTDWIELTRFTTTDVTTPITDPEAFIAPSRFYRIWLTTFARLVRRPARNTPTACGPPAFEGAGEHERAVVAHGFGDDFQFVIIV